MPDNQFVLPRSTLELLDSVPESLLRRLKQYSGRFSTQAVSAMQERLPFFAELEASQRASVALVVQTAGLRDGLWLDTGGSPLTDAARITERFHRVNFGKMEVEITVDDPRAFTGTGPSS